MLSPDYLVTPEDRGCVPGVADTTGGSAAALIVVGDQFDATAEMSLNRIAARLATDIVDVQSDGLIPPAAVWDVVADESGPQDLIRITLTGLDTGAAPAQPGVARKTKAAIRAALDLAARYNRFESDPYSLRFLTVVEAVTDLGQLYATAVGAMA